MKLVSPCKINLNLKVFEKNDDGYHRVQTLMVRVGLFDEMEISIQEKGDIQIYVTNFAELNDQNNIVYEAIQKFQQATELEFGIKVELTKKIPMGAGLGGGSANAAFILRYLNQHFDKPLEDQKLYDLAASLGSDVGFFMLDNAWAVCSGYGNEIQTQASMDKLPLVICFPEVSLRTAQMYEKLNRPLTWDIVSDTNPTAFHIEKWEEFQQVLPFGNDFEEVIDQPWLTEIKQAFEKSDCIHTALSGSGSAVFGLYESENRAIEASQMLQKFGQVFVAHTF